MIYYNGMLYEDMERLSEYLYRPNVKNFSTENINVSYSLNMSRFLPPMILDSRITYKGPFKVVFGLPAKVRSQISEVIFPPATDNSEESRANDLNYKSFVHAMAEMVQKYAPKLLEKEVAEP